MSLKKLGRYDLVRVLGKGAMGVVYEGRDPNLERRVAIKTVKVENLSEEAAIEYEARFRTEARSAARLQHPNIVSVYDSDRDLDIAYLVMEYIQGEDLKHHLDRGIRYSLEQSLRMIRDLLSALDYAHKQGIVHRDVKPANLLIEPGGRLKLTDFGVARIQDSGEATRTQGSMVGTLKYMSPEQVQGQKIDARADLFSVGVVLYQLLTDKRPFDGDNDFSIIHQIIGHTPPPPSSFNARLPSAIDAVVARALAKDREQRFASARDFASALQSAIRRAQDQTVVPPANPQKQADAGGTGSKGQSGSGMPPTSGSSVTQEIELVYWKDVKDSTDPEELQGFLDKFPAGIYADLGRRRLRKLVAGNNSPDQTLLSGTVPGRPPDAEATRLRSGTTPSMAAAAAPADGPAAPLAAGAAAQAIEAARPVEAGPVEAARPGDAAQSSDAAQPIALAQPIQAAQLKDAVPAADAAQAASAPPAEAPAPLQGAAAVPPQSEDSTLPPEVKAAFACPDPPAAGATLPSARRAVADALGRSAAAKSAVPTRPPAPAAPPGSEAVPQQKAASRQKAAPQQKAASQQKAGRSPKVLPALAVLAAVALGVAALFLMGRPGPQETLARPAPAASGAPATDAAAAAAELPASTAGLARAEIAAQPLPEPAGVSAAATSASPPTAMPAPMAAVPVPTAVPAPARRPASASRSKPAATPAAPVEAPVLVPAPAPPPRPQPARDEPRAAAVAAGPAAPNPVEACKDKVFVMKELCLAEHCDKPGARNHLLCVKWREDARLREESRIRN